MVVVVGGILAAGGGCGGLGLMCRRRAASRAQQEPSSPAAAAAARVVGAQAQGTEEALAVEAARRCPSAAGHGMQLVCVSTPRAVPCARRLVLLLHLLL